MGLKDHLRQRLRSCKACYRSYTALKYRLQNILSLRFFLYDMGIVHRSMFWGSNQEMKLSQLQAKLLFYFHKIEKGLCMPGKHRLFGLEVIPHIVDLVTTWESSGFSRNDPIYLGALNSLSAYADCLKAEKLDPDDKIQSTVSYFLERRGFSELTADTPIVIEQHRLHGLVPFEKLKQLYELRRSTRDFDLKPVSKELVENAVQAAQLSPSACNRQPCKVYAIENENMKSILLSHQNGNAGFGHLAPLLLVITADADHFFGAIERNQPYVDGGLFTMSLLYALQTQGLATCCLNWCVTPKTDHEVHRLLGIPLSQKIVMYVAVGHPHQQTSVPKSHRKSLPSVLAFK